MYQTIQLLFRKQVVTLILAVTMLLSVSQTMLADSYPAYISDVILVGGSDQSVQKRLTSGG